jgi:hypothetical protein
MRNLQLGGERTSSFPIPTKVDKISTVSHLTSHFWSFISDKICVRDGMDSTGGARDDESQIRIEGPDEYYHEHTDEGFAGDHTTIMSFRLL